MSQHEKIMYNITLSDLQQKKRYVMVESENLKYMEFVLKVLNRKNIDLRWALYVAYLGCEDDGSMRTIAIDEDTFLKALAS